MPIVRSSLLPGVLAALLALPGCSLAGGDDPVPPAPSTSSYAAPPDVVAGVEQALRRRARAVVDANPEAFDRGVRGEAGFREQQRSWFANLRQLPVGELSYTVDPGALLRDGDDYWVVVEEHLRLSGYDAVPVVSRDRYRFRPSRRNPDRMVLTSVTDEAWERDNGVRPQPWDLGPVEVRSGAGVLGIFDAGSLPDAGPLVRSVERGIDDVAAVVPYEWSRSVVVYALSDPTFLASIPDVPGGDPDDLDGVAFPVTAAPGEEASAAYRFALHPRMLDRRGAARDRLVRHELTHVALGARDDQAPVWLSEGLAEYVSAQPMAPQDRRVPARAVRAAEVGFDALPADDSFNGGEESETNYALAWFACEYLARSFDEATLWSLLDQLGAGGVDADQLLRDQLRVGPKRLAQRAGELIVAEYGDPPPVVPPTPAGPGADPAGTPAPEVTPAG
ncbi:MULTISPECIES: hypothetical protein [unclassified Nocardioides]|uniref:hypothetical protein n=1 Tax=unclassified Nocardioides TaxID=2615069 RepID=UPI003014C093